MPYSASAWEQIWRAASPRRLWSVPDPAVEAVVRRWKNSGTVSRVIDVGCGAGRHAALLAREGFDVYACDRSAAGVSACLDAVRGVDGRIHAWRGDIVDGGHPPAFFDAAIAFNVVYHGLLADVRDGIASLRACLRPGGECLVTWPSRAHRLYGKGVRLEPHTFASTGLFPQLFPSGEQGVPHHFADESQVRDLFRDFELLSLDHRELRLPSQSKIASAEWFTVSQSFFWTLLVRTPE